jgi:rfaE bifunctional protein kinase chain/domain
MDKQRMPKTDVRRKIKTVEELQAILGQPPRKQSVVMCHGTFDIVHPGHLRHLLYAKERGHILIASLTADKHITKANYRPFVPQELRALNLAALECVDYVLIDQREVPLENIRALKPDFFAKGFEYFDNGIPPRTKEEMAVLEEYGGEMIFTPGDVVFSSSALIEAARPRLGVAKLQILLQSEGLEFSNLRTVLQQLGATKVHVLGDTIVDCYTYCRGSGSITKTPTISVQQEREVRFCGGAAIVAKHLRKAGAEVTFSTVLGNDELREFVLEDLKEAGVTCDAVLDRTRPTTEKNSFICQGYHILRVSKLDNRIISDKIRDRFCKSLAASNAQAYVFSDFRHGVFSRTTIPAFVEALPEGALRVADSQVASRWGNILEFQGFDLITPNEREARFALGDQDSVVRPLSSELKQRAHCKYLILKLGERGVMAYRDDPTDMASFFTVDSFCDHVVDAVGAGDALLAYSTLALKACGNIVIASILGSLAAAVACEHEGNIPVAPEEVLEKINSLEKMAAGA